MFRPASFSFKKINKEINIKGYVISMWIPGSSEGQLLPEGQGVRPQCSHLASRAETGDWTHPTSSQEWSSPSPGMGTSLGTGWTQLEPGPAVALLGQWLMALGDWNGVLDPRQDRVSPRMLDSSEAWWCPWWWPDSEISILLLLQHLLRLECSLWKSEPYWSLSQEWHVLVTLLVWLFQICAIPALSLSQCSSYIWKLCLGGVFELSIQYIPVSYLTTEMVLFSLFLSFGILCMNQTKLTKFFSSLILTIFSREVRLSYPRHVHSLPCLLGNIIFRFFYVLDYASVPSETLDFYYL